MEFQILGPLEVRREDSALEFRGAKQRVLLATLLLRANEVVSSDSLIEALWGEEPPATADKALQMHVSRLRDLLEPDLLVTRAPGYELRLDGRAARPAPLRGGGPHRARAGAVRTRRGRGGGTGRRARAVARPTALRPRVRDLAPGGHRPPRGAPPGGDRGPRRRRPRARPARRAGRRARAARGRAPAARAHPRPADARAVPDRPPGRGARGLSAGPPHARRRARPGARPGAPELERAILNQDPELDPPAAPAAPPAAAAAPDLVGRERELAELVGALDAAFSGTGALALIGGEPGIGKSRLAEALASRARERGGRVLVGRCWEAGGAPPYWPWVQALRSYARDAGADSLRSHAGAAGPALATMLPEVADPGAAPPEPGDSESARFRVFEAVAALVGSLADEEPLVFLLDDLHAADAPSLLLLRFLARELTGSRVLVVGCYRDTEVGPELAEALAELTRDAVVARVALKGLAPEATTRLLELAMGRAPAGELASRVQTETGGNPLFAGEVGRLLATADPDGDELPIPDGVKEAIGRRLQRQSEACRDALTLASVLGREFDVDAIERVGDVSQDELFATLEEAVDARLVGAGAGHPRTAALLARARAGRRCTRTCRSHAGCACTPGSARRWRSCTRRTRSRTSPSSPTTSSRPAARGSRRRSRTRAEPATSRRSQHAYEEAARHYTLALDLLGAIRRGPRRGCLRAAGRSGRGPQPRRRPVGREGRVPPGGRARRAQRPLRSARARRARIRRALRLGARRDRRRAGAAAGARAGGDRRGRQPGAGAAARPPGAGDPRRAPARPPAAAGERVGGDRPADRRPAHAGLRARRLLARRGGPRQRDRPARASPAS